MDYSKHGTQKKRSIYIPIFKKQSIKSVLIYSGSFIFLLITVGVMGIAAGIGGMRGVLDSAPEITVEDVVPQGYKSLFTTVTVTF